MQNKVNNSVEHPLHYNFAKGYEVIDVIEAWDLNFNMGAAVKYIARAGKKDPTKKIEDLKKAIFHLDRQIKVWEKKKEE